MGIKTVKTISGETEYRTNCKKIKDNYYVKDKDCFELEGRWYRINSGVLTYDHEKKIWLKTSIVKGLKQGIVGHNTETQTVVLGMFTPNKMNNVLVKNISTGEKYVCLNSTVALSFSLENVSTGEYFYPMNQLDKRQCYRVANCVDHKQKGYNIEDNIQEFEEKGKLFDAYCFPINKSVIQFAKLLSDKTFGAELECIKGYLPEHIQYKTGTIVCRDGSLHAEDGTQGPEFTTIPLSGAKGIQSLIILGKELSKRTQVNHMCSMHLHIGNLPTSRLFLVTLYNLCYQIQDEMFDLFPFYKRNEVTYANKDKDYCQKLHPLSCTALKHFDKISYSNYVNEQYTRIFDFLSMGAAPSKHCNRRLGKHPKQNKWERKSRYYWVNIMNMIFSKRNTVEFRIHTGTTNPQKIVSWLFLCNAIINTAIIHSKEIMQGKKFTLTDVINSYNSEGFAGKTMADYLKGYIAFRKESFRKDMEINDCMSNHEFKNDSTFVLHHPIISPMFNYEV